MKINKIASQPDRAGRLSLRFEDGTTMRLFRQTIEDFCLYAGKELSDEEMKNLTESAGAMSAKMRAVRILSASGVSKKDLEHRLIQKGEKAEHAKNAVAWMEELDLVDDRKTALHVVERCISKGYGLARAKQALYEKRIPKEYWEEALRDYPDQIEHIVAFLQAKLPDAGDKKQLKKVIDALMRKGHSYGAIRKALDKLSWGDPEFQED